MADPLENAVTDIKTIHENIGERGLLNMTSLIQTLCRNAIEQIEESKSETEKMQAWIYATARNLFESGLSIEEYNAITSRVIDAWKKKKAITHG